MAVNASKRRGNVKNKRSHALNTTKAWQKTNKQIYTNEDGTKVRLSMKEIRTAKKNEKTA